jgi:hypothetical protein
MEGLGKLKKYNNLIGIRTRDLLACSEVPHPTTLPSAPMFVWQEVFSPVPSLQDLARRSLDSYSKQRLLVFLYTANLK